MERDKGWGARKRMFLPSSGSLLREPQTRATNQGPGSPSKSTTLIQGSKAVGHFLLSPRKTSRELD